jgi:UDP-4-amino-4,6-dideoxy-N-acetyl-beta-L-altrosamine transaminase
MKLAIDGGKPVRSEMLQYGSQWIGPEDVKAVTDTLQSPFITQGPTIETFENRVAEYVGARYAVAFCNGTAALHAACHAAGIRAGDEAVTTPNTFAASANCVLYAGGRPVFADIDPATYNLDPLQAEKAIGESTRALIPVDFAGQPAEMEAFMRIARDRGLVVIQDGAHSLGAVYKGRKVGTWADMTMFSFHPVKPITTGEGGMIVTDSEELAEKLRIFRSHGVIRGGRSKEEPWFYEMVDLGMNYRMTDLQAALGLSQMDRLDSFLERRREIASAYNEAFQDLEGVKIPCQLPETLSGWHLYVLRLQPDRLAVDRKTVFHALRAENIGVHVHYIPVYWHPYYQRLGYRKGLCPKAEQYYEEALTLPIFPRMTDADVRDVILAVTKVIGTYMK